MSSDLRQHPVGYFALPLFVRPGKNVRQLIGSMPGHAQISPDQLAVELEEVQQLGLGGVILFGIPSEKDATGSDSTSFAGVVQPILTASCDGAVRTGSSW